LGIVNRRVQRARTQAANWHSSAWRANNEHQFHASMSTRNISRVVVRGVPTILSILNNGVVGGGCAYCLLAPPTAQRLPALREKVANAALQATVAGGIFAALYAFSTACLSGTKRWRHL